jgi:hypothetical protein
MHWTWQDVEDLPTHVYEVLVEELIKLNEDKD